MGAHFAQGREKAGAQGVHHHSLDDDVGTRHDRRGDKRKSGGGRIGGHDHPRRAQVRAALERYFLAVFPERFGLDGGAKILQHFFGVVAGGLGLDDGRAAGRIETGKEHRRFDLRRGDRRRKLDRKRFARALEQDRAAPPRRLRQDLGSHRAKRIENPLHRAFSQRGIAVVSGGYRVAAGDAHHQTHPGSRIAEIEGCARCEERADPAAPDAPAAFAAPVHLCAERGAGGGGVENVAAFEKTLDFGFAGAEETENQGAVRNRLVARGLHPAAQWTPGTRGERGR